MAIALRGSEGVNAGSSTTTSITLTLSNASAQAGDVAIVYGTWNLNSETVAIDRSGWTAQAAVNISTTLSARAFHKTLTSGDITDDTVTLSVTSAGRAAGGLIVLSGANGLDTVSVNPEAAEDAANDTSQPFDGIDPVATSMVVAVFALNYNASGLSATAPSGWTERTDTITSGHSGRKAGAYAMTYNTIGSAAVSAGNITTNDACHAASWTYAVLESSGISASLTPATETDTAQVLGRGKARSLTPATETDTAQVLGRGKARSLTHAAETDTAVALGRAKARSLTPALETDVAVALGKTDPIHASLTPAAETDAAVALGRVKARTLGIATETDTAVALGKAKAASLTHAAETDTAVELTRAVSGGVTPALETDTAVELGRVKAKSLTPALETDVVVAITSIKAKAITPSTETDTAVALTRGKARGVTPATETDTAVALTHSWARTLTVVTETDTAVTLSRVKAVAFGAATETDTAVTITVDSGIPASPGRILTADLGGPTVHGDVIESVAGSIASISLTGDPS